MSLVSFIVIAFAFGIYDMLLFRRCAEVSPVRLSAGLVMTAGVAIIHALFLWLGAALGNVLRFELSNDTLAFQNANCWVFFALSLFVAGRSFFPYLRRESKLPVFSLASFASVFLMAIATGINILLVGIGIGYADVELHTHRCLWPMLFLSMLLGYLGVMFGRQHVKVRHRRWAFVSAVMILGVAIASFFSF